MQIDIIHLGLVFFKGKVIRTPLERASIELSCLVELQKWEEASQRLREFLPEYPDQWSYIREYAHVQVKRGVAMVQNGRGTNNGEAIGVGASNQSCAMADDKDKPNGDGIASADGGQSKSVVQDGDRWAQYVIALGCLFYFLGRCCWYMQLIKLNLLNKAN